MFMEKKEISSHYSLNDKFLQDLNKEIRTNSYKKNERSLRYELKKRIEKEELF